MKLFKMKNIKSARRHVLLFCYLFILESFLDAVNMQVVLSAWDAFERVGPAEGERAIAQAAVYCACAPKSNRLYMAYRQCRADVKADLEYEVPHHMRNAPTELMQDLGYGQEYRYAHDEPNAYAAGEVYLPAELADRQYYQPSDRGLEIKISEKLRFLKTQDQQSAKRRYLTLGR